MQLSKLLPQLTGDRKRTFELMARHRAAAIDLVRNVEQAGTPRARVVVFVQAHEPVALQASLATHNLDDGAQLAVVPIAVARRVLAREWRTFAKDIAGPPKPGHFYYIGSVGEALELAQVEK